MLEKEHFIVTLISKYIVFKVNNNNCYVILYSQFCSYFILFNYC